MPAGCVPQVGKRDSTSAWGSQVAGGLALGSQDGAHLGGQLGPSLCSNWSPCSGPDGYGGSLPTGLEVPQSPWLCPQQLDLFPGGLGLGSQLWAAKTGVVAALAENGRSWGHRAQGSRRAEAPGRGRLTGGLEQVRHRHQERGLIGHPPWGRKVRPWNPVRCPQESGQKAAGTEGHGLAQVSKWWHLCTRPPWPSEPSQGVCPAPKFQSGGPAISHLGGWGVVAHLLFLGPSGKMKPSPQV